MLDHHLWQTGFSADAGIVGRTVELNRQPFTVVGVAAEGVFGDAFARIGYFAPISTEPLLRPNNSRYANDTDLLLTLIARREAGAGLDQVHAELGVIAAQLDRQQPGRATTLTVERAKPIIGTSVPRGAATGVSVVLMAAFGCILLIASVLARVGGNRLERRRPDPSPDDAAFRRRSRVGVALASAISRGLSSVLVGVSPPIRSGSVGPRCSSAAWRLRRA